MNEQKGITTTILYNVTIQVSWGIHEEWLIWMKATHIKEVMQTGCFMYSRLLRLMEVDETEGPTYAAQYESLSKELYNKYIQEYATTMREKSYKKWGDQFIAFRSVMEVVQ